MGTGIDLFLDWENGIWVAGTGIWPLSLGPVYEFVCVSFTTGNLNCFRVK
jgi:hypothetical protein